MKWRFLLPLALFLGLVALFMVGLGRNPGEVPSPLINRAVPEFSLPRLDDPAQQMSSRHLRSGEVVLVNVWASWCTACREEHPFLMELARTGEITLYGLNYKDDPTEARRVLARYGNPYAASAVDREGRVGIDWGVYGVPETFLVDGQGRIRFKQVGPLSRVVWEREIRPLVARLKVERP